jgi:hypothetical protein
MIAAVALGKDPSRAKQTQSLTTQLILRLPHANRMVTALVDCGAHDNFLSQKLVVEEGLQAIPTSTGAHTIDGHRITIYGRHACYTQAIDMDGTEKDIKQEFLATDSDQYEVILGLPWIEAANPDCYWRAKTWRYRAEDKLRIKEVKVKEIAEVAKIQPIYAIFPLPARSRLIAGVSRATLMEEEIQLPAEYCDYADVFSKTEADKLPKSTKVAHSIEIEEGKTVPFGPIYALSANELRVLREYLDNSMAKGWIQKSKSPAGAPILFTPKKDGCLRLCVDYRGLNKVTKKNRYPLPLIGETLDRLSGATQFTKLDLRDAYHRIRIREGDEWKTAFRTRYGHFEYLVMPFGLTNAPASFQAYINEALHGLLDIRCQAYMDDIIIYSFPGESHADRVREVLERLRKASLFVKLSKCEFSTDAIDFLGYRIGVAGISMDMSRVRTIQEWPIPESFRDIQVFMGFCNFYRRFIYRFSAVTAPLTDLLKGMQKGRKTGPFQLTAEARQAFSMLQQCFMQAPLLQHFDPKKISRVETDASGDGIGGVLSQPADEQDNLMRITWKPVAFFSRKLSPAEQNYGTPDQEMLAIVEAFKEWRHYLEAPEAEVEVLTDHHNLQFFMTTKALNRRQARWAEALGAFDFRIAYRKGSENPADAPSRRPDYRSNEVSENTFKEILERSERNTCVTHAKSMQGITDLDTTQGTVLVGVMTRSRTGVLLPRGEKWSTLPKSTADSKLEPGEAQASSMGVAGSPETESPYGKIPDALTTFLLSIQSKDAWCRKRKWKANPKNQVIRGPYRGRWCEDHAGLVRRDGAVYVPEDSATRAEILRVNHDDPWQGGHFGRTRTLKTISRYYWWPRLANSVQRYCESCDICQRVKAPRHKPYGLLVPLPQPKQPWQDITFDFITGLPPAISRRKACDAIFVVVDRFSKMVRYLACTKVIDAPHMANLLYDDVFSKFGFPRSIISDRGSLFTSAWWSTFCHDLTVKRRLSTAFHPQTDGQTERQNQTLEVYLRAYVNYQQDNWASYLASAEFAYNNSVNVTTGKTPFQLCLRFEPAFSMNIARESQVREGENPAAREAVEDLQQDIQEGKALWEYAQAAAENYYNKKHKDMSYKVGDEVLLSSRYIRTRRACKKLDDRFLGPFRIVEAIGKNAYKLDLPKQYGRIHRTFGVALLEPYHRREGQEPPPPVEIEDEEEWLVDSVLDARVSHGKRMFLVRWEGYTREHDSWEPEENLENAQDKIAEFYARIRK